MACLRRRKAHCEVRLRRPDGRQNGKTFATRKAAEAWERGQLTAQATGGWVDPDAGKVPFCERAVTYATDRPKALAPKTVELCRKQLDRLILPTFAAMPFSSITTDSVRAWLAKVRVESSELQAAKAYRLLRAILNVAVSDGLIVRNPCSIRGAGQEHSAERPLASAEQIHKLADARKATRITQYTLHDLRHAAGTMAAWTGATTKELMARLGHSTPQGSIRYQHTARTRDEEIARRLDVFRST